MRKVAFRKWIPLEYEKVEDKINYSKAKAGTNCLEEGFPNEGMFHQWANAFEESSAGYGNYTVALIELKDGSIIEVLPTNIRFLKQVWNVFSPDGITIEADKINYESVVEASEAADRFAERFKAQGYYSTIKNNERVQIPYDDIVKNLRYEGTWI